MLWLLSGALPRIVVLVARPAVEVPSHLGVHHGDDRLAREIAVDELRSVEILERDPSDHLVADRLEEHDAPAGVVHVEAADLEAVVAGPHPIDEEVLDEGVVRELFGGGGEVGEGHRFPGDDRDRNRRVDPLGVAPGGVRGPVGHLREGDAVVGGDQRVVAHGEGVVAVGEFDVLARGADHLVVDDHVGLHRSAEHRGDDVEEAWRRRAVAVPGVAGGGAGVLWVRVLVVAGWDVVHA